MEIDMKEFQALLEAYGKAAISRCSLSSKVALKAAFDLRNFVRALSLPASSGPEQPTQWTPEAFKAWHLGSTEPKCGCHLCDEACTCECHARLVAAIAERASPQPVAQECKCGLRGLSTYPLCQLPFKAGAKEEYGCCNITENSFSCRHPRACHTPAPAAKEVRPRSE